MSAGSPKVLGSWSPGQIFMHLARGLDLSIDGAPSKPWYIRMVGQYFLKQRFVSRPMQPGWKLPAKELLPGETTADAGLNALRGAIQRVKTTLDRKPHPIFGPLTSDEWIALQCRHAELHLSFLLPSTDLTAGETTAEPHNSE
jgi:hypothetical protein